MTIAADIAVEALSAGLLLTRNGEHIHIESPLGRPLPEDLRVRLMERKSEVLAWLDWCEIADELLLACSRRLARSYPAGLLLNEARWRAAEEALQRAHASQDPRCLPRRHWRSTSPSPRSSSSAPEMESSDDPGP